MNDLLKLVENVGEAYVVGQKIVDYKLNSAKSYAINESSKVISSMMSLLIVAGLFIAFLIFVFLLLGKLSASYWQIPMLVYGAPALLSFITTFIFWIKRESIFRAMTKNVVRDVLR